MKHCPCCGHKTMYESEALNPVSMYDGKTTICQNCAKTEQYIKAGLAKADETVNNFLRKIGRAADLG